MMMEVERGAETIIKPTRGFRNIMHCICRNCSISIEVFEAVATITIGITNGGAENIVKHDSSLGSILYYMCENKSMLLKYDNVGMRETSYGK